MRWAESADPELLKGLSNEEIQRNEILHELITTETEYVKTLNVVVDVSDVVSTVIVLIGFPRELVIWSKLIQLFLNPLREKAILKRHEIFTVFGPFESILAVNKPLLEVWSPQELWIWKMISLFLGSETLSSSTSTRIAPSSCWNFLPKSMYMQIERVSSLWFVSALVFSLCFLWSSQADEFRVYGPYCGLITTLQENTASLQRTNDAFDKFLSVGSASFVSCYRPDVRFQETSKRPECKRLLLSDFLIEPLQRLLKYPLLLTVRIASLFISITPERVV